LRAADIGISVDSAVDIAKEAADIILLEKSLLVLDDGVVEGRTTFCNMLKYIRMTASSNFGNVFSVLIASVFLPFLPMLPLQLLTQNLLYDVSQTGIPFDRVDDELIRKPLVWNANGLGRFMLFFGPLSSIFDVLTFGLMWFVFSANTTGEQTLFQSGWFIEGLLTQTLVVHLIRTPRLDAGGIAAARVHDHRGHDARRGAGDGAVCWRFQDDAPAAELLPVAGGDPHGLHRADQLHEALLREALWLAVTCPSPPPLLLTLKQPSRKA